MSSNAMDSEKLGTIEGDLLVGLESEVGVFTNFGGVTVLNIAVDTDAERIEISPQNRRSITGSSPLPTIGVTFLENIDPVKMAMLLNASVVNNPGAPVPVVGEALGTGWIVGEPIKLANKNGDNTEVASIIIDADSTPLVLNTDYEIYVADGINGETGYTYVTPKTAQAGVLDADYTYTPNESVTITRTRKYTNDNQLVAKIVTAPNELGQVNTYTLKSCIFKGLYQIDVQNLAIAGDIPGTSGTFEGNRGEDVEFNVETV